MKVLFDGYWLINGPPSGRNVLRSYVAAWREAFPDHGVTVAVAAADLEASIRVYDSDPQIAVVPVAGKPHGISVLSRLDASGFDLVISQNFAPVRKSAVSAVFVHDVIFVRHPEWFSIVERVYLRISLWSLRRTDLILTSSQAEAFHLRKALSPKNRRKVRSVGLGLSRGYQDALPIRPPSFDPDLEYILTVGRLNVRKNIVFAAKSLLDREIVSPAMPLIVVGNADGRSEDYSIIGGAIENRSVIFAPNISDAELKWLYAHARLFVFPSLDEGFGLPVLEAQATGTPSVLSDIPAFRELSPDGVFFDPTDSDSIAASVAMGLSSSSTPAPPADAVAAWSNVILKTKEAFDAISVERR
jgi:glycosyltransferase involved in cell wall biosynthesis